MSGVTLPLPCMSHGILAQGQLYFLGVLHDVNNTASGVPRDVAQQLYQSILYDEIIVRFHGTRLNVILFTPVKKVRPSLRRFSRKSEWLDSVMCMSLMPDLTKIG